MCSSIPQKAPYIKGFTLAELLIALAILGVIATFTIPKVITAQQNRQANSIAKEAAGTISAAFQLYKYSGGDVTTMSATQLTSYLNYIKMDTSSTIDDINTGNSVSCIPTNPCFKLANGAILHHWGDNFCNAFSTAIPFDIDPDGIYGGLTGGPSKSVRFFLYNTGRITTEGTLDSNTQWTNSGTSTCKYTRSAQPTHDPTWFSW